MALAIERPPRGAGAVRRAVRPRAIAGPIAVAAKASAATRTSQVTGAWADMARAVAPPTAAPSRLPVPTTW